MDANPLRWLDDELAILAAKDLLRIPTQRDSAQRVDDCHIEGRSLVNFSSNDYLGLASDPALLPSEDALRETGWGSGASAIVTGRGRHHAELERAIAHFEETEDALLFSSGFAANAATIPALVDHEDVVFSDAKNHASIIDGCRLARAETVIYRHADVSDLEEKLAAAGGCRRKLIVTDTLFSMDGDLAPLPEIAQLASEHDAMLMVDEAHATGVFGAGGRGVCEYLGAEDGVHIRVGTLSKALGSSGGFVAGSKALVRWLANCARSYVFSTAPPEALAIAGLKALGIVVSEPERRVQLLEMSQWFRESAGQVGLNIGLSCSQIVPVMIGDPGKTMMVARLLRERGFLVPGIRPPTVPQGESLLRVSICYPHTLEQLSELLETLKPALNG